jgi:hypothetical protein
MNEHITIQATESGYLFKCTHCKKLQRVKSGKGNFNEAVTAFTHTHAGCKPKVDGRGKTTPLLRKHTPCVVCGLEFGEGEGKVPLYRDGELYPAYAHLECADKVLGYHIGHHNIVVMGAGEWLYFWRGGCGEARNKADALLAIDMIFLRERLGEGL